MLPYRNSASLGLFIILNVITISMIVAVDEAAISNAILPVTETTPLIITDPSVTLPTAIASIKGPQEPACKNNGTFVITGPNSFICKCPENTFGADCSVILTCEVGSCGSNASCTIFNNKKFCTCLPGYTGNPDVACNIRTKTACVSGDPHYTTFDGAVFDYMGTCPYYLMKPCHSDSFSVIAINALLPNNPSVSTLKEFTLKTQGHEFKVNFNLHLFVDGIYSNYPYYWPSKLNPKIIATKPANAVYIHDNFTGTVFTYYQHFLCAEIPVSSSSFFWK